MSFIDKIDEIPVPDLLRKRTDNICTLFAVVFSVSLLVYCGVILNTDNALKVIFPSDGDGSVCGVDYPAYPYLYFGDLKDISKRLCVSRCPTVHDARLNCRPTSRMGCFRRPPLSPSAFRMYDTEPFKSSTRIGRFCVPRDPIVREQLLMRSQLTERSQFISFYDTIIVCTLASVLLGFVYMLLVQFFPQFAHYASILVGSFATIGLGVWVILYRSAHFDRLRGLTTTLAVVLIVCGAIMFLCLLIYRRYLRVSAVFLNHSTKFISDRPTTLIFIPLFLVLTAGLITVSAFEFVAVWSSDIPKFVKNRVFYIPQGKGSIILSVLILIQLYWGLAFLKELFNFCISGNAINWYFGRPKACCQPLARVIRFHFGSVVGGAFMVGFFGIGDFIFTLFKPESYTTTYGKCYFALFGWLTSLFELVRSDAMAYINLTGLPYCNASRFCEFLCNNTRLYNGSQSASRFYRIGAHFLLVSFIGLLGLFYKQSTSLWVQLFIIITTLFTVTFFIDIHANAAEAISISFLTEEYLQVGDFKQVKMASPELISDLLTASNISYQENSQ